MRDILLIKCKNAIEELHQEIDNLNKIKDDLSSKN